METAQKIKKEIAEERFYIESALNDLLLGIQAINKDLKYTVFAIIKKSEKEFNGIQTGKTFFIKLIEDDAKIIDSNLMNIDKLFDLFSEGRKLADALENLGLVKEKRILIDYQQTSEETKRILQKLTSIK